MLATMAMKHDGERMRCKVCSLWFAKVMRSRNYIFNSGLWICICVSLHENMILLWCKGWTRSQRLPPNEQLDTVTPWWLNIIASSSLPEHLDREQSPEAPESSAGGRQSFQHMHGGISSDPNAPVWLRIPAGRRWAPYPSWGRPLQALQPWSRFEKLPHLLFHVQVFLCVTLE